MNGCRSEAVVDMSGKAAARLRLSHRTPLLLVSRGPLEVHPPTAACVRLPMASGCKHGPRKCERRGGAGGG